MIRQIFMLVSLALSPGLAAAASCKAEPESPVCSQGVCTGTGVVEGNNHMAFSLDGSSIGICEAVMCMEGKTVFRRVAGDITFVSGKVRKFDPITNKLTGPAYTVSAMLDKTARLAHVAWDGRGIMMTCEV